jgi:hypothetical protein
MVDKFAWGNSTRLRTEGTRSKRFTTSFRMVDIRLHTR